MTKTNNQKIKCEVVKNLDHEQIMVMAFRYALSRTVTCSYMIRRYIMTNIHDISDKFLDQFIKDIQREIDDEVIHYKDCLQYWEEFKYDLEYEQKERQL